MENKRLDYNNGRISKQATVQNRGLFAVHRGIYYPVTWGFRHKPFQDPYKPIRIFTKKHVIGIGGFGCRLLKVAELYTKEWELTCQKFSVEATTIWVFPKIGVPQNGW